MDHQDKNEVQNPNKPNRIKKLYENVVIGNFLYGLGFAVRSCLDGNTSIPSVVNLLQQTPADRELADVLLSFPGVVRLIEFKMKGARLTKERIRHRLLMAALSGENQAMVETSRSLHWYVEVAANDTDIPLVSRAVPYLDAFDSESLALTAGSLERLVEQTACEAVRGLDPVMRERSEIYLRFLRSIQADDPVDAGGVLLVMGASGAMHFAQLRDICDLSMPHWQWLELEMRGPELGPSTPSLERSMEHPKRRSGREFSM
ncbi:hypothetical protein [Pseudomonas frederiksbergensis]|uniref:hypothetical protein n=1 Tax=Pseudomonas frederiksbergensis TaxID=104087 RepID=UPI0032E4E82F